MNIKAPSQLHFPKKPSNQPTNQSTNQNHPPNKQKTPTKLTNQPNSPRKQQKQTSQSQWYLFIFEIIFGPESFKIALSYNKTL